MDDDRVIRFSGVFSSIDLFEQLENLKARCDSIQKDLCEYTEANPKYDDQWTEERLRALELKVKRMEEILGNGKE